MEVPRQYPRSRQPFPLHNINSMTDRLVFWIAQTMDLHGCPPAAVVDLLLVLALLFASLAIQFLSLWQLRKNTNTDRHHHSRQTTKQVIHHS